MPPDSSDIPDIPNSNEYVVKEEPTQAFIQRITKLEVHQYKEGIPHLVITQSIHYEHQGSIYEACNSLVEVPLDEMLMFMRGQLGHTIGEVTKEVVYLRSEKSRLLVSAAEIIDWIRNVSRDKDFAYNEICEAIENEDDGNERTVESLISKLRICSTIALLELRDRGFHDSVTDKSGDDNDGSDL